jgi:hypothetical protein
MTDHEYDHGFTPTVDHGPFTPNQPLTPTIEIEREILPVAVRHGCELWWDGSTPTQRLDQRGGKDGFTRFVNSRIEGKLSEVAFKKFLHEYYGIDSAVDWRIYGDYTETDNGDLRCLEGDTQQHEPAVEFDIKKTKPWNQWLAIRRNIHRGLDDDAPIILTKHAIGDDIDMDPWAETDSWDDVDPDDLFRRRLLDFAESMFPVKIELVGTAYPDEFTDSFDKGDRLYDPTTGSELGPPLRCNNEGIHVDDLDARVVRWNRVVYEIVGDNTITYTPLNIIG